MPKRPAVHNSRPVEAEHQRKRDYDRRRPSAWRRLYDTAWRIASRRHLWLHPLCVDCFKVGRITPATVVDHDPPHRGDPVKFWDESTWFSRCKTCHDRKTATEDSAFARRGKRKSDRAE